MAKLVLNDITSLANSASAKQTINDNFAELEAEFDNTLSRDGTTPNQMEADFDLNGNDLLNAFRVDAQQYYLNGVPLAQSVAYANKDFEIYSGNGSQTDFSLPIDPGSLGNLEVSIDGVMQRPGIDFTYVGTTLQFTSAPPTGTNNILVRLDEALLTGVTDGSAVVFNDLTAPAYLKTTSDMLNGVEVHVRRFFSTQSGYADMLSGATTFDATVGLQAAIAAYGENQSRRGGRLILGRGRFIVNDTLRPTSYAIDNAINLEIVGEGYLSTWLDFSAMTGNKDAIVVPGDQQISLKGFFLKGGAGVRDGIHLGRNLADGGSDSNGVSVFNIEDVRVQSCSRDGVHHYNSYMGTLDRVYTLANGRDGFHGEGFHTSLTHRTCYALDNAACGFNYNGIVYSSFIGCGSDLNQFGYALSNARGVSFLSCGAEGNNQDGWFIFAAPGGVPTSNPLFVQECYDVHGVTLQNCSGYGNNVLNSGYGGLVRLLGDNVHSGAGSFNDGSPHTVEVSIRDCDANSNPGGTKAIVTQQTAGGSVKFTEGGFNYFPGGRTVGTGTIRRDESLIGKSCVVQRSSNQSIPVTTDTDVVWAVATDDIGGCWSGGTPSQIVVPAALEGCKVVIEFVAGWASDTTGARRAQVFRNGAATALMPIAQYSESDAYGAAAYAASPPVRVVAGESFKLVVAQDTAGALDFVNSVSYMCMKVVG